jgi:hypothetical protein
MHYSKCNILVPINARHATPHSNAYLQAIPLHTNQAKQPCEGGPGGVVLLGRLRYCWAAMR